MSYKKPICDCGEELISIVEESVEYLYKINKNGKLSKRKN